MEFPVRRFIVRQFILAAVLGSAACSLAAAADVAAPQRKAGLWEITTVAPVSGMTTRNVCIGENDDIIRPEGSDCTEPELTPLDEGIIVTVACSNQDGKQIISSTFTGDFETRYHGTMKTTFDPPIGAIHRMGVNIDGKYLGPECPKGLDAAKP
ncbi:DUF3617 domain-containing protein [Methyloceanibacter caenitepidi]|uniref:DUF3617 family protein n=1 Tax=Methyloceanibacter caenitepidi TaxID=1384459 RepID=A0A0A8K1T2_9HYPH|nr:DUF3617 family protein [Methyloceanibacter caenitepidi]BAQ15949.1 hypothetical protein GL4_0483 [Methyloceanibacter caenitepidi]